MQINDEMLERLGVYFVYWNVREKRGLTFEQFVERHQRGTWEA